MADIDKLVDAIKKKQCILFLGAGINKRPPDGEVHQYTFDKDDELPDAATLCKELISKSGLEFPSYIETDNLQRVSQYINVEQPNRFELNHWLADILNCQQRPSPLLKALAELDFPLTITTNYDRLFEKAIIESKKIPEENTDIIHKSSNHKQYKDKSDRNTLLNVIVYSKNNDDETPKYVKPNSNNPKTQYPTLFKMHGDLCLEGEARGNDSAVISDEDYIDFIMRMTSLKNYPIPQGILDLFYEMPIIFIGYSLRDYNFRLLMKILHKDKNSYPMRYSLDPRPDELIKRIFMKSYNTIFFIENAWKTIPEIYKRVKDAEMPDYYGKA